VNWLERMKSGLRTRIKREIPEGIWSKCPQCGHANYQAALERQRWICPECGYHFPLRSDQYVDLLTDSETFLELDADLASTDPLRFRDTKRYADRLKTSHRESGLNEAVLTGVATIGGHPVALAIMDTRFIMGTLGSATGEKLARLISRAMVDRRVLIIVCQSGGARMMEGTFSLMQMAKVSAKLGQLAQAGLLYVTLLTDPTSGGDTASFGMLGDVILAEPGARVGFAGQNVIKQFLGTEALPAGFQVAETVLQHGFIDRVVRRDQLASELTRLMAFLSPPVAAPTA
jgi:acetyl-CoA carboxylase carboxyl transferase subunit beta